VPVILLCLVPWTIWTDAIKPRLIPADEIARVADDIVASYPIRSLKLSPATSARAATATVPSRRIGIGCGRGSGGGWEER
jgi:hypothetical protein